MESARSASRIRSFWPRANEDWTSAWVDCGFDNFCKMWRGLVIPGGESVIGIISLFLIIVLRLIVGSSIGMLPRCTLEISVVSSTKQLIELITGGFEVQKFYIIIY